MQVLFGIYGMEEAEACESVAAMNKNGAGIKGYERRYSKAGVAQYLDEHPDTDAAIISECLEQADPYTAKDFEKLVDAHENLRIIPVLNDGSRAVMEELFLLGIYNAVCTSDAHMGTVAFLVKSGRSRRDAKQYYRITDTTEAGERMLRDMAETGAADRPPVKKGVRLPDVIGNLQEKIVRASRSGEHAAGRADSMGHASAGKTGAKKKRTGGGRKRKQDATLTGTATCFVTGLKHGCGNTHFSAAAANYLHNRRACSCLVTEHADCMGKALADGVGVQPRTAVYEKICSEYETVIFDAGVYGELGGKDLSERVRADYKVMMCCADEWYMRKLAEFIAKAGEAEADTWIYVFGIIPDASVGRISRLMECYRTFCLPLFEAADLPEPVCGIMDKIFV